VTIRQLILGKITEFPGSPSWRIGNGNQELSLEEPWGFTEMVAVPNIGIDVGNAHMTAVKMGDVTGDAVRPLNQGSVTTRSSETLRFVFEDQRLIGGEMVRVDFRAKDFNDIEGFQFALDLNGGVITEVVGGALAMDNSNHHIDNAGLLRLSWSAVESTSVGDEMVLFTVIALVPIDGLVSQMIRTHDEVLGAEAYRSNEVIQLELGVEMPIPDAKEKVPRVDISPNPFSSQITIQFHLDKAEEISLVFYDRTGRSLSVRSELFSQGLHRLHVDAENLECADGVLFCQITTSSGVKTVKLVRLE
jgi:hypothetical protein